MLANRLFKVQFGRQSRMCTHSVLNWSVGLTPLQLRCRVAATNRKTKLIENKFASSHLRQACQPSKRPYLGSTLKYELEDRPARSKAMQEQHALGDGAARLRRNLLTLAAGVLVIGRRGLARPLPEAAFAFRQSANMHLVLRLNSGGGAQTNRTAVPSHEYGEPTASPAFCLKRIEEQEVPLATCLFFFVLSFSSLG